ncbi:MAG: class I SAM-dependent methyltransferase [Candidatus Krumholzibacteria bacterium]|nr:class I SAM-dependent methyltransferase [Gemmatimonadota bacterium]MDH5270240.1 class I SAM-dependent methyltransferase [Candidatus Krumholzibacteria bacterium]
MAAVSEHYANHLAPIYLWMVGGIESAVSQGKADLAALLPGSGLAIDLGAGLGMHSIPLAQGGYQVVAIDQSPLLLSVLQEHSPGLPVRIIEANLLEFRALVPDPSDLIICMGDTLTHLESFEQVQVLLESVAQSLSPKGRFVATFRDYSTAAAGDGRFIQVRSDDTRILTCFLEEEPRHIKVHDIVHDRRDGQWQMSISSYRKLRIAPSAVEQMLRSLGMNVQVERGPRGMVRIEANA